jgi:predicted metal-binding protein
MDLSLQNGPDAVALQACAGLALACAYSSSEEYEAEVIQARRAAGAYGSHQRHAYVVFAAVAAAVLALFLAF